mgnify:CR=1 FL=1
MTFQEKPTFFDLFAGAGGLSLGFENAGFQCAGASELHSDAIETYKYNRKGKGLVIEGDIRNLKPQDLFDKIESNINRKNVDVVIGGPPCQGFSLRGKRRKKDPRNELIYEYYRIIEILKPKMFVMENVSGLVNEKNKSILQDIFDKIANMGYKFNCSYLLASDYGVPQNRKRFIIIGAKPEFDIYFPEIKDQSMNNSIQRILSELDFENEVKFLNKINVIDNPISAFEALDDIAYEKVKNTTMEYRKYSNLSEYQKFVRSPGKLHNHKTTNHRDRTIRRFEYIKPGERTIDLFDRFPPELAIKRRTEKRILPDEPTGTITSCNEDFIHYKLNRIITIREMARLQSFPDDYRFRGTRTTGSHRRKKSVCQVQQVGNSVPPLMAQSIAESIRYSLGHEINGEFNEIINQLNKK